METPHSPETEKTILGTIALDAEAIRKLSLQADDFYFPRHKKIFAAMVDLDRQGVPPDPVTLLPALGPEECAYLSACTTEAFGMANTPYYCEILRTLSQKRALQKICVDALQKLQESSVDDLLSIIRRDTSGLVTGRGSRLYSTREMSHELWDFIERRFKDKAKLSGIPSGITDLDKLIDGAQGGELTIIGGRPGKGKSALMMYMAQTAAAAGLPVGIISLEMGAQQIGIRALSSLSRVELWKLRKGILSSGDWSVVADAIGRLSSLPIFFSFSARDAGTISRTITEMVEIQGCKLVCLDYLQLAKGTGAKERREREIAEISWTLKTAATTHNIPVIALSQLNRDSERQARKPILADLRESGAIEQDADVILFVHRGADQDEGSGPVEIIIAKGRNCGTGAVNVYFDADRMNFRDLKK